MHNRIEASATGQVWRAQEAAKEIVYFQLKEQKNYFRIEYTGELMLERANYMAGLLKTATATGNVVGVDYDDLVVSVQPPNTHTGNFHLVKYIQIGI
ncbi:MAG: hypothetical protein LH473_05145 [Chitinophagales bacterium]|nr:hypothetical protein [Chitinophagales bacterium]